MIGETSILLIGRRPIVVFYFEKSVRKLLSYFREFIEDNNGVRALIYITR